MSNTKTLENFYKAGMRAAKDDGEAGKIANALGTTVLQQMQAAYNAWEEANNEDPVTFSAYFSADEDLIYGIINKREYDPGYWDSQYGGDGVGGMIEYGICLIKQWVEWYANGELIEQGGEPTYSSC